MRTHTARAAVFAAALVLAACSNAGADGEAPASGSASGTVAGTSSSATSSGSITSTATEATTSTSSDAHAAPPSSAAEEHDDGIAWVPFGPATSGTPAPQPRFYGSLYAHECDTSALGSSGLQEDQQHLYEGALAACRAVAGNAADAWTTAQQQLAAVADPGALDCMDSQALRLLQQLVAAHQRHPDAAPTMRPGQAGAACPTEIKGVEVLEGGGGLKVTGTRLWGASSATIDNVAATEVQTDSDAVFVTAGAHLEPGSRVTLSLVQGPLPPQTYTFTVPDTAGDPSGAGTSP